MKSPFLSKTLWVNLLLALLAIFMPGAVSFIQNNPQVVAVGFALVNIILRLVTKTGIQLTDDSAPSNPPAAPSA